MPRPKRNKTTPAPFQRYLGFVGPEGASLACPKCGAFEYVTVKEGKVKCPKCHSVADWSPLAVACASPSHNDATGCTNRNCWKNKEASS